MSMLVGVSDGAALREGIIQQPGPFYNGNPSSIIWGTSPAAPLWRDESGSPFSSPGFGVPPPQQQQQQQQHSEKERGGMGPALRGRRHVTRAQMTTRNLSNPPAAPIPSSSPFAFGFPPPPAQSSDAEAAQDERMEDIEELLPGWAKLSVSDPPGDAQSDQRRTSAAAQDFSRRFRTLDLNDPPPAERASPGSRRASESGVFVFGAKGEAGKAAPAQNSSAPGSRPRPVKVKRGGSAAKGKGIAAGGNLGAPSPIGPPPADRLASQAGECSFSHSRFSSQPLNLGRPVGNAGYSSDESISQGFAPFSPPAVSAREHASPDWGPHSPSSDAQSPSRRAGRPSFVFGEVGKDGLSKDGNLSGDSTTGGPGFPNVAEPMIKASAMGGDSSSPAFRRRAHARRKGAGSSTRSGKQEFSSDVESHQAPFIEEASLEFAVKLGLGSVSKEASSTDGKFSKASGSGTGEPPNEEAANKAPGGGQRDAENPHPTSSVPTKAVESAPEAKGPAIGAQKLSSSLPFLQLRPKAAPTSTPPDLFVFGSPRSEVPIPEAPFPPAPFKFASAGAVPSPPSSRSTTPRRGFRSRPVVKAAPSIPAFEQDESAASQSGTPASHPDADALSSSFLSLNFGTPKPPVNESSESEGVVPDPKTPSIPSLARDAKLKGDSEDPSSKNSSASPFVFSAGKGSVSSAEAKPELTQGETKVPETPSAEDSPPASDASEARSTSRPSNAREQSFEFRASGEFGVGSGKNAAARRKAHRTPASVSSRRQSSRYRAASKENKSPGNHFTIAETGGTAHEASGSPMDFSPQRYTPPDDTIRSMERNSSKPAAWTRSAALDNDGLGDDEWGQFSETDVAMENLRKAASDLTFGSRPGSYSSIRGDVGSEREDQFVNLWRISTEESKASALGTSLQQDQNVIGGQKVPLISKDNTWSYVKMDAANQPESVVSSSTPSVDSSTSSSGWGHFTFTAGSSPTVPSTTSFLRRHARRIQGDRHARASSEANKATSSKSRGETVRSTSKGAQPDTAASESSDGSKEPLFSFDKRVHPSSESEKGFSGSGGWDRLQGPNATLTSRSTSASTESSSSFGSLPRADVQGSVGPQTAGAAATEQVCERWRLRGNQAYANGDFPKAEEYYSRGASSVPPNETSQSCIRASMLCYSNRAATRMVVGRMREALADCLRAMAVDPNFLRVRLRAASCHLALGESDSAALAFKECIRRAQEDGQQDTKVTTEASDGLRKTMQVEEYLGRVSEILANASTGDTLTALRLLNEVLLSSPHSERTLELKSRALLLLRRYDEVVQLCEQSLVSAERNHPLSSCDITSQQSIQAPYGGDGVKDPGALKVWRLRLTAKARFHLGRLEEALDALQNLEELASAASPGKIFLTDLSAATDHFALSPSTVRDLLRHKAAGNDAFQNGRHTEAVEHYSAALACNGDSRPFSAVCFCNRAAASQALGNVGDAISDCSRAIALDPKYAKAISRRATLHEKVRDYGQSCHDLQKFISLLESQEQQTRTVPSPVRVGTVTSNTQQDLRQAYERLAKAEEELKKGHPLDHYMILGLEPGCSSNEIKKAYRKAALRHHPDKAGQFLARSEGDDGAMWKEVADEVRHDAERLFKLIGEANAILSDPQKRSRYDAEEEFRKLRTRTSVAPSTFSEIYRRGGQGGGSRRPRYDSYSGYGHQYQRWQSGPDAAQPDTYARRGRCGSNNNSRSNGDGSSKNGSRSNGDGSHWSDYDWDEM